jgi:hypothetical protein
MPLRHPRPYPHIRIAGVITPGDFGSQAVVQTFDSQSIGADVSPPTLNGLARSFTPGGDQIADECFLAERTDSVLLNCLSAGRLTPFSVSADQSVGWLHLYNCLSGRRARQFASRLKNNLLLSAEIGFVSLWCFMQAINC